MTSALSQEPTRVQLGTNKPSLIVRALLLLMILSALAASAIGSFDVSLIKLLLGQGSSLQVSVITEIRLPRILLSAVVGASLGISGAALQGLFRNPLADPGLIGVSAGAALGAATMIVITPTAISNSAIQPILLPLAGIIGAASVTLLLYALTRGFAYRGMTTMLLVGIAINAIVGVAIGILTYISTDAELRTLTFWTMGSFGGIGWSLLVPALLGILWATTYLLPSRTSLDLVQLGEIEAYRLGVDIRKLKFRIVIATATLVGCSVALSGMIGFVGLVVPHLARLIGGVNHIYLLPASATLGAVLMIIADLLARTLIQPAELPIGLITSAIGSPFFLWLVFRMKNNDY